MILLDTHVLVWLAGEPELLSPEAARAIAIAARRGGLAISAITLWELAWLAGRARLRFRGTVEAFVEKLASRVSIRPITASVAVLAAQLPAAYSNDPGDRLIGATALADGIPLVTKDRNIRAYEPIQTIW